MSSSFAKTTLTFIILAVSAIWCYQCVGSHPGCGMEDFDWRFYWSSSCQDANDVCVKVVEQIGSEVMVTRDCLSSLEGHRRDIPNDRYEGCRPAAQDVQLGNYIFPSVPEIDHTRTHYSNVTFCFCTFDERCNTSSSLMSSMATVAAGVILVGVMRMIRA
ncbi:hypothetical protein HAZT_HAZT007725 [Hyalella azteca]|uniref:Protein sleepless n=1 Tax=Hyalella azteca TaxID=294128 RepID=A0A6A0GNX7_HYAAZ|nr:hypothetical protein HAZT_HAZT007725 [Hyalella azteca]